MSFRLSKMTLSVYVVGLFIFQTVAFSKGTHAGYKPRDILASDRLEVDSEVAYIKNAFYSKFGILVEVKPQLISVDSQNKTPRGEYSYHQIEFGKLSKDQFETIQRFYRFPLSNTLISENEHEQKKNYSLLDFLVPKIQPLPGHFFVGEIPLDGKPLLIDANCWSTVQDVLFSNIDPFTITGFIDFSSQPLKTLTSSASKPISFAGTHSIKAYDYFIELDDNPNLIKHTAVFVGPGIVFEKTAPSEIGLYRIGTHRMDSKFLYRRLVKTLLSPQDSAALSEQTIPKESFIRVVKSNGKSSTYELDKTSPLFPFFKSSPLSTCTQEDFFDGKCD